jgi:ribonuclease III
MALGHSLGSPVHENQMTASGRKAADASGLMKQLGHDFAKPSLLQDALTHPSLAGARGKKAGGTAYERLEFLGDRVLGLVVAEWLYERFPEASEGEMAKRHAALVNRDALRAVADAISLGQYLHLARGEETGAPRKNIATLPDAMEAVIGALYFDGSYAAVSKFIHQYWQKEVEVTEAPADPKTILQEWAQGHGLPLPQYKVVSRSGPAHAPKFVIEASVKNQEPASAEGDSKRAAEKAAAKLLMEQINKK